MMDPESRNEMEDEGGNGRRQRYFRLHLREWQGKFEDHADRGVEASAATIEGTTEREPTNLTAGTQLEHIEIDDAGDPVVVQQNQCALEQSHLEAPVFQRESERTAQVQNRGDQIIDIEPPLLEAQVVSEEEEREHAREIIEQTRRIEEQVQREVDLENRLHSLEHQPDLVQGIPVESDDQSSNIQQQQLEGISSIKWVSYWRRMNFFGRMLLLFAAMAVITVAVTVAVVFPRDSKSDPKELQNNTTVYGNETDNPQKESQWVQLGIDINGETENEAFGGAIALSSSGNVVAVGPYINAENGDRPGQVRVFLYNETESRWGQMGQSMVGEAQEECFGESVALAKDGTILAAGASGGGLLTGKARVFRYDVTTQQWTKIGQDIVSDSKYDSFGQAVDLNADGTVIAISGGGYQDIGYVKVFSYDGNSWEQIGRSISSEQAGDGFGCSIALSSAGTIFAVGAVLSEGNGLRAAGRVRTFALNEVTQEWSQIGQNLDGDGMNEGFGGSVALSPTGTKLAAGNTRAGLGETPGYAKVYEYNKGNQTWDQLGLTLTGEAPLERFGCSVALSRNGTILAAGAFDGNENQSGYVKVFQYNYEAFEWNQLGKAIHGERQGDRFGFSVDLASDGSVLAIGGTRNGDGGRDSGHIRVYGW